MKIQKISSKNDKDVIVHLDNGEKLYLSYEVLLKNGLRKDKEISETQFNALINENRLYFVKQSAYRYLGRRLHSAYELKIKLRQKGYESAMIDSVIEELEEKKYLDDHAFAVMYAEENIRNKKWGITRLKSELLKRKISSGIIDKVISANFPEGNDTDNAEKLAGKKMKLLSGRNLEEAKLRQKIMQYLYSKGYDFETSQNAVNKVLNEADL